MAGAISYKCRQESGMSHESELSAEQPNIPKTHMDVGTT